MHLTEGLWPALLPPTQICVVVGCVRSDVVVAQLSTCALHGLMRLLSVHDTPVITYGMLQMLPVTRTFEDAAALMPASDHDLGLGCLFLGLEGCSWAWRVRQSNSQLQRATSSQAARDHADGTLTMCKLVRCACGKPSTPDHTGSDVVITTAQTHRYNPHRCPCTRVRAVRDGLSVACGQVCE